MKRPSVQRVALVEPLTVVAALVSVLSFAVGHPNVPITDYPLVRGFPWVGWGENQVKGEVGHRDCSVPVQYIRSIAQAGL